MSIVYIECMPVTQRYWCNTHCKIGISISGTMEDIRTKTLSALVREMQVGVWECDVGGGVRGGVVWCGSVVWE